MEVIARSSGELHAGTTVDFLVHQAPRVRRLAPPFRLHSVYTAVEPERRLRQRVTGDLTRVLEVHLEPTAQASTRIVWDWYVSMSHPLLNLLGFFLEPTFRHSHDTGMAEGEQGLRAYCAGLQTGGTTSA